MKKLVLNEKESQELIENGSVEIERNGYAMLVEYNPYFNKDEEENCINKKFNIMIFDCFDKVIVKAQRSINRDIVNKGGEK